MPLYEFECRCGTKFEEIKKITRNYTNCPACGEIVRRNDISAIGNFFVNGFSEKNGYGARSPYIPPEYRKAASGDVPFDKNGNCL
jgi:putative FmdB family regulatory protein